MATLEKIRSKSALLFTVIIVALLAFILGDFLTSGRTLFGGGTTVAQLGSHKIDAQLFQQRVNEIAEEMKDRGQTADYELLQAQVVNDMLMEQLMQDELDNLGIEVSGATLVKFIGQNPQYAAFIEAVKNPAKYGIPAEQLNQYKAQLVSLEQQFEKQIGYQIYGQLFNGLYAANEVDAKAVHEAINKKYDVSFVTKELASEPDDQYQVTDAEIMAEWEKYKPVYKADRETRAIKYFTVNLIPSNSDLAAADKLVCEAVAKLSVSEGVDTIADDVNFKIKTNIYTPSALNRNPQIKAFADSAKVGKVAQLTKMGDTYHIVKLLSSKVEMDSVNIAMVQVNDSAAFDSVYNALKGGAKVKDFSNPNNQAAKTQATDSIWITMTHPNITVMLGNDSIVNQVKNAKTGDVIPYQGVLSGQQVNVLYVINKATPAVKILEVAEIEYTVEPSDATIAKLTGDLEKFLAENNNLEKVAANAPKSGYALVTATVDEGTPRVANVTGSRAAVKWAMNAGKGEVSAPFKDQEGTHLLVVAVEHIYNDYITPETEADRKLLIERVKNEKKAAKIIKDLTGKNLNTLEAYATAIGDSISTTDVSFMSTTVNTLGQGENVFVGAVAGAQKGQLIGPFKTNKTVAVVRIDGIRDNGRPYNFAEYSSHYAQQYGAMPLYQGLFNVLKGDDVIEWHILDLFENGNQE